MLRFPEAFGSSFPPNIAGLWIDFNTIPYGQLGYSHGIANKERMLAIFEAKVGDSELANELFRLIETKLDHVVSLVTRNSPEGLEMFHVAVDGIVVAAKIAQQRIRRYESAEKAERRREYIQNLLDFLEKKDGDFHKFLDAEEEVSVPSRFTERRNVVFSRIPFIFGKKNVGDDDVKALEGFIKASSPGKKSGPTKNELIGRLEFAREVLFDTNTISPGTSFMEALDLRLQRFFEAQYKTWNVSDIVYSSHRVPGEGEHKIFELLRQSEFPAGSSHVIYSNDGDLFFISLASKIPGINVWRVKENQKGYPARDSIVNIDELRRQIRNGDKKVGNRNTIELEIAFFISILGNDFMPPLVEMGEFSDFADAILERLGALAVLTDENTIYWRNFFVILESIVNDSDRPLLDIRREQYPFALLDKYYETGELDEEAFRKAWYWRSLGVDTESDDFPKKRKDILSLLDITERELIDRIAEESTRSYLAGLVFVLQYYMNGVGGVNPLWSYPYYYPPLLSDLIVIGKRISTSEEIDVSLAKNEVNPLQNIIYQQLMIIPPESKKLLHKKVQRAMTSEELKHLYPSSWRSSQDYRIKDFEVVSFIPQIDPLRVMKFVDESVIPLMTGKEANAYTPGEDLLLRGKPKPKKARLQVGRYTGTNPPPKSFSAQKKTTYRDSRFEDGPPRGRGGRGRGRGDSRGDSRGRGRGDSRGDSRGRGSGDSRGRGSGRGDTRGRGSGRGGTRGRGKPTERDGSTRGRGANRGRGKNK